MARDKKKQKVKVQRTKQNYLIFELILFAVSFILYANTLGHDYALDDYSLIKENRYTQAGFSGIGDILTHDMFSGHVENYKADLAGGRYRPLSQITMAIEYQFFKLTPSVSHFVNIVLFGLTPVMIFLVLMQLLNPDSPDKLTWYSSIPFLAALFYAVHPIHTEVVANIKGRDEIMAMLLVVTSFYYFIKYIDYKEQKHLYSAIIIYFLALMAKENAITYMAIFPLSLMMFREKKISESIKSIIPFLIATLLFLIIRQSIVGFAKVLDTPELMNEPFAGMNFIEKYSTILATLFIYFKLIFVPYPLTYDYYPYHIPKYNLTFIEPYLAIIIFAALLYFAFKYYKTNKIISFSIFYYIITLSIVSNLLFTIGSFMNERFVYMSSLSASIFVAYLLVDVVNRKFNNKNLVFGLILIICGVYSFMTISRNPVWKDNYTLMTTDVKTSTNSAFGNFAAGGQYFTKLSEAKTEAEKKKYFDIATKLLYKSLEIYPRYSNAAITLGNTYYAYNANVDSTIKYYKLSFDIYPYNYQTSLNLGRLVRDAKKDLNSAEFYFKQCIKTDPNKYEAYNDLGVVYFNAGQYQKSAENFEIGVAINPNDKQLLKNLYAVYIALGDKTKAEMYLARANSIR
jgi:tetratricopeptide (TPR) repeat protein